MELQTVTLHLPDATYRRLVELSTRSERPLPEETVHLLNSAIATDEALTSDITARLAHLSLLTDEELWNSATSTASEEDNDLMQALLEKRQRVGLTSNESEQLQVLSAHFNQIMMTRAKSAAILLERGHDISVLAPQ